MKEKKIYEALRTIKHPKLNKPLLDLGMIRDIAIEGDTVSLSLVLKNTQSPVRKVFTARIEKALKEIDISRVNVEVTGLSKEEIKKLFPKLPLMGIKRVKYFLAVASGKGGVGKTTVAVNIALALSRKGHSVGLLDADVYGPSIPLMLDLSEKPTLKDSMLVPVNKFGLKIMSFGMLIEEGKAVIWRGPLVARAIRQLLGEVSWGELDYLVIDLPPGTGDPSITIAQSLPEAQVLMVTTPQEVALTDVRRSIALFTKHEKKILGFIENMSYFKTSASAEPINIFGQGGGKKLSKETGLPLLGTIPIDLELGQGGDKGIPLLVSSPSSDTACLFMEIAEKVEKKFNNA